LDPGDERYELELISENNFRKVIRFNASRDGVSYDNINDTIWIDLKKLPLETVTVRIKERRFP
jgi:hypothetical protein